MLAIPFKPEISQWWEVGGLIFIKKKRTPAVTRPGCCNTHCTSEKLSVLVDLSSDCEVIICTLYGPYRVLCRVLQRDYTECSVYWLPSTRQSTTLYALFEQVHRVLCEGASQHHTDHSVSHVLDTLQSTLCAMFQIAYRVWGHQCLEEYEYYVSLVWSSTQSTLQTQFQISDRVD